MNICVCLFVCLCVCLPLFILTSFVYSFEKETAYVMIPMESKMHKSCFHCCQALKGERSTKQSVTFSEEETVLCSACGSKYCSQRCKEAATTLHNIECPYIPKLREIAKQTEMEFSFVCFLVRLLIQRHLEILQQMRYIYPRSNCNCNKFENDKHKELEKDIYYQK